MTKNIKSFLTEKEITRAQELDDQILKYIKKYNIKRNQSNKYRQKLEDSLSESDKNLLDKYYSIKLFSQKLYLEELRTRIKRSLKYSWEHGIWTNKAPVGYKNYRDKKGRAQIKVNPNMAYKIRQLFKVRAYGLSLSQLEKYMATLPDIRCQKAKPYIFKKYQISRILHNPFYTGTMIIKGKAYPHNYPKIVSQELFDEVQQTFKQ